MYNRILKLFISIIYWILWIFWNKTLRILGISTKIPIEILIYHDISDDMKEKFERQMDTLLRLYAPYNLVTNSSNNPKHYMVGITFDDGFKSILRNAIPVLKSRSIPAIIFIPVGYIGKKANWISSENNTFKNDRVMLTEELKSLPADLIKVGSHGLYHKRLDLLEKHKAVYELKESKRILENELGVEIDYFAFPYAEYNEELIHIAQAVGYKKIFTGLPEPLENIKIRNVLGRVNVSPKDWLVEFKLKSMGAYKWLPKAVVYKRKLINYIHCKKNDILF